MDINEIRDEIARLENGITTYSTCEKLAILYNVRDGLMPKDDYSYSSEPEKTEFMQIAEKAPVGVVLEVLDEHLLCVKAIYPKEYEAVCNKLK